MHAHNIILNDIKWNIFATILDAIKREITPPPPDSVMDSRENRNAPFSPSLNWGEGWS